jgi:outer membrane protein OmpA-like peptidoglycan-associated protein
VLDSIALFLKEYPNVKVEIGGHTDSRGSDAYNLKLSQARAEAVRDYLIKVHNISPDRLIAKGYGERRLVVYPEKTEEDYQMNRRVEFTILGTTE